MQGGRPEEPWGLGGGVLPVRPGVAGAGLRAAGRRKRGWIGAVAAAALSLTLRLAILATRGSWSATLSWSDTLHLRAVLTPLSSMVAILVPTIALPVLVYAAAQERRPGLTRLMAQIGRAHV